ncbi:DUF402 domain-containing protein [Neobacillus mesonae]|nr:DUF402 domain-containing protein [Neobacillus mesonae]
MNPITVVSRLGKIQGYEVNGIVYFDRFDDLSRKVIRHYILVNEGVKLMYEPWGWINEWYVDLVEIKKISDHEIELTDLYIDIVVEGNGPTYRLIDLEEYADAVTEGQIDIQEMNKQLKQVQTFLENYLHRGKVFPPEQVRQLMEPSIEIK